MEPEFLEQVRRSLAPYLSDESKSDLIRQLRAFAEQPARPSDYFTTIPSAPDPLQGDVWRGLVVLDFDTSERDQVVGMVLSNSCDISTANEPYPDQRLVFAPLLALDVYAQLLQEAGKTHQQVDTYLEQVRRQKVYRIFYVPAMPGVLRESIVALDAVHSEPLRALAADGVRRLFSLNNFGWYMLLLKLSIHFTRMDEKLDRIPVTSPAQN